jgi:hypothetical protein
MTAAPAPNLPDRGTQRALSEDIDRLSAAAEHAGPGDIELNDALWSAVHHLEYWYFIPRGEPSAVQPMAIVLDEGPMLLAFTSLERAHQAADRMSIPAEQTKRMLAMPSAGVVELADEYAHMGLYGVMFDSGWSGFFAPVADLRAIRERVLP